MNKKLNLLEANFYPAANIITVTMLTWLLLICKRKQKHTYESIA